MFKLLSGHKISEKMIFLILSGVFLNTFFVNFNIYEPFRTGKILYLQYYLFLLIPVFIYLGIKRIRQPIYLTELFIILGVTYIFLFGYKPGIILDLKFIYLFVGIILYLIVVRLPFESNGWLMVITTIIGTLTLELILGVAQYCDLINFGSTFEITGTFFNPALYLAYLVICLPYFAYFVKALKRFKLLAKILISFYVIGVAILCLSYSRAAFFALTGVGFYFFLPQLKGFARTQMGWKKWQTLLLMTFFGVILLIGAFVLYDVREESANGRILIWKVSSTLIENERLFGHGFNSFQAHYGDALSNYFQNVGINETEAQLGAFVKWAFNEPIQLLVEFGLVGTGLFFIVTFLVFIPTFKKDNNLVNHSIIKTAKASIIAFCIFSFFSYPLYSPTISMVLFFSLGIASRDLRKIEMPYWRSFLNIVCVIWVGLVGSYLVAKAYPLTEAFNSWYDGNSYMERGNYLKANESFIKGHELLASNGVFLQEQAKVKLIIHQYDEAIELLQKGAAFYKDEFWYITLGDAYKAKGLYQKAEFNYGKAMYMSPSKLYPKYLLVQLYLKMGQIEKAKEMANQILMSDVKVRSLAIQQIEMEMYRVLDIKANQD